MRFLPYGSHHLLLESDSLDEVLDCFATLESDPPRGVVDLVPAARTVLVEYDNHTTDFASLKAAIEQLKFETRNSSDTRSVEIAVRYNGEDLPFVQEFLGLSAEELVAWHTKQTWKVAFTGFAPGFGYLVGDLQNRPVPRLAKPRVSVPAGAVAIAGEFTGVYPRSSPGGWRVIGHTDLCLWDLDREPPAQFVPGSLVNFVEEP